MQVPYIYDNFRRNGHVPRGYDRGPIIKLSIRAQKSCFRHCVKPSLALTPEWSAAFFLALPVSPLWCVNYTIYVYSQTHTQFFLQCFKRATSFGPTGPSSGPLLKTSNLKNEEMLIYIVYLLMGSNHYNSRSPCNSNYMLKCIKQYNIVPHLFTVHASILITTALGYINCQIGYNCGYNTLTCVWVYSRKKKNTIQWANKYSAYMWDIR